MLKKFVSQNIPLIYLRNRQTSDLISYILIRWFYRTTWFNDTTGLFWHISTLSAPYLVSRSVKLFRVDKKPVSELETCFYFLLFFWNLCFCWWVAAHTVILVAQFQHLLWLNNLSQPLRSECRELADTVAVIKSQHWIWMFSSIVVVYFMKSYFVALLISQVVDVYIMFSVHWIRKKSVLLDLRA